MDNYVPPFSIPNEMVMRITNIVEKLSKLNDVSKLDRRPYLRKQKNIKSVHSSLAIENNKLNLNEVKDVINGKNVIGTEKDILEVKNAYKVYEMLREVNAYSIKDLKKAHKVMTDSIQDDSGQFRKGEEGVFSGDVCIFVCPGPKMVTPLINNLFNWLKCNKDKIHPLILSSVFHYEFVFIHPFSDGNGRIARFWQNVILYNWKDIFEYLPIESNIHKYQGEYYKAINDSNVEGNSNSFICFMLKMIEETIDEVGKSLYYPTTNEEMNMDSLLKVMGGCKPLTAYEIMDKLGIKSKETLRNSYLNPAIRNNVVSLTIPDKPTSRNQRYYIE